jgi:hypothetical protein
MHYTANWVTTNLVFRIHDITVEIEGYICQRHVLYEISLPMTCIDILGLFICASHTK